MMKRINKKMPIPKFLFKLFVKSLWVWAKPTVFLVAIVMSNTLVEASTRPPSNHFGGGYNHVHIADMPAASLTSSHTINNTATNSPYASGDILGSLHVPRLGRTVQIVSGATMSAMDIGAGHFGFTGLDYGNIGLIGHNRGRSNGHFSFARLLLEGDTITLTRGSVTRYFTVSHTFIVDETDFAPLQNFGDNRLTLVTCVEYQQSRRRIVVALEV